MDNIYDSPEKFGLRIVGEVAKEENYDFDKFVVWSKQDGSLWFATDSGCSCPSPFEDYGSIDKLEPYETRHLDEWLGNLHHSERPSVTEVADLKTKCREWVRTNTPIKGS